MHLSGGASAQAGLAGLPLVFVFAVAGLPAALLSVITYSAVRLARAREKLDCSQFFLRSILIAGALQFVAFFISLVLI